MHSEYIEQRNGGYYLAGTRISLDSVVYSFNEGQSPDAIQEDFGIPILHYVELNFDSFINVVNALGGMPAGCRLAGRALPCHQAVQ